MAPKARPAAAEPETLDPNRRAAIQSQLAWLGYGADVGASEEVTRDAIAEFQRAHGLPADGIAGPQTLDALDRMAAERRGKDPIPRGPTATAPPEEAAEDPGEPLVLSDSVIRMRAVHTGPQTAFELAAYLLQTHGSYAGGRAGSFEIGDPPEDAERRTVDEWLEEIRPLFNRRRARSLHARLVIWGLALVDPALWNRLRKDGFLDALRAEIREADSLLTRAGQALLPLPEQKRTETRALLDRPALYDRLGREAFAIALAARVIQLRDAFVAPESRLTRCGRAVQRGLVKLDPRHRAEEEEQQHPDGPFLVHLQGAWGAGKSTLLNFFAKELERPSLRLRDAVRDPEGRELARWVVVPFNAWQHQRIAPPWWWLITAVYHTGGRKLAEISRREWLLFRLRDYGWRFRARWPAYVVPAAGIALISLFVWLLATRTGAFELTGEKSWFELVGGIAGGLSAAVALLISIWSGVRGVKRWMLVGTARGADNFMKTTEDPMATVQRRYEHLVRSLRHPLAIIIDDLDRCRADYVVELLEGIQTLFSNARVTYVVAADVCWMRDSFLQVYEPFVKSETGPGEQLGYGFLDKTFQLSTAVPRMKAEQRARFLESLLAAGNGASPAMDDPKLREAIQRVRKAETGAEVREAVAESGSLSQEAQHLVREEAVIREAGADITEETENFLLAFSPLLAPNPRSITRLVNAYSFESKLRLLEPDWVDDDYSRQRLALWTILQLRWPELADHLAEHPEQITVIRDRLALDGIPERLHALFDDDEVRRVVRGDAERVSASLDEDSLKALIRKDSARRDE